MSQTVDTRVVEMQFNNAGFKQHAIETISILDKLKNSLGFGGNISQASASFDDISESVDNMSRTLQLIDLEGLSVKFSALEIAGMRAIQNITDSAMRMGTNLVKSLSIDQVSAGWQKYGQKTSSVQTIMNSTGKSMDEINGYLSKLMWFSDETSYGFTDMTQSLGQLTAAGGNIDELIPMILGIANATAYAGKGAAEFSRVIYNLNQSYGQGALNLMDWKSVEMAGAGSAQLKQAFIDEAIALGKLSKEGKTAKGTLVQVSNFSQTLAEKWADKEVMQAAFGKFAAATEEAYKMVQNGEVDVASEAYAALEGRMDSLSLTAARAAQEAKTLDEAIDATRDAVSSGWMQTIELIVGNYDQAKKLWTDVANELWEVFASGAEHRNEILALALTDFGGRERLINALATAYGNLKKAVSMFFSYWDKVLPTLNSAHIYGLIRSFDHFAQSLELTGKGAASMVRIGTGVAHVFNFLLNTIKAVFKIVSPIKDVIAAVGRLLLTVADLVAVLAKRLTLFGEASEEGGGAVEFLSNVTRKLADVLINVIDGVTNFVAKLRDSEAVNDFGKAVEFLRDSINNLFDRISESSPIDKLGSAFETIGSVVDTMVSKLPSLESVIDAVHKVASALGSSLGGAINGFNEGFEDTSGLDTFGTLMGTIFGGSIAVGAAKALFGIGDAAKSTGSIFENLKKATGNLAEGLENFFGSFAQKNKLIDPGDIKEIAVSILMLAGALFVISMINPTNLGNSLMVLVGVMASVIGAIEILGKTLSAGATAKIVVLSGALVVLSGAILVLAVALKLLGTMNPEEVSNAMRALGNSMLVMVVALMLISAAGPKILASATALSILSFGLIALGIALKIFGTMDPEEIANAMRVLTSSLLIMGVALGLLSLASPMILVAASALTILSVGLIALGGALMIFSMLSPEEISNAMRVLAGSLLEMGIALGLLSLAGPEVLLAAAALTILSVGLVILGAALLMMSSIDMAGMNVALTAMGGALLAMCAALGVLTVVGPGVIVAAAALTILSVAMIGMAFAMMMLSTISWDGLSVSIVALAVALGGIGAAGALLAPIAPMLVLVGAGLLTFAASLIAISFALNMLATIKDPSSAISTLVEALVILGGASAMLGLTAPAMVLIGGALLALSVGMLAFSASILAFSASVAIMGTVVTIMGALMKSSVPGMIQSITDATSNMSNVLGVALQDTISKLNGYQNVFKSVGSLLMDSLQNGIMSRTSGIANAAEQAVKSAVNAAKAEIGASGTFGVDVMSNGSGGTTAIVCTMNLDAVELGLKSITDNIAVTNNFWQTLNDRLVSIEEQVNSGFSGMTSALEYLDKRPVDVNVSLQGDADRLFSVVRDRASIYKNSTGRSAFG